MTTSGEADPAKVAREEPGWIPADTFANRLLLARAHAGHLSIRDACERTGLNRGNWQGWERGLRPRDPVDTCQQIADALGVDFHWLLLGGPLLGARGKPTKRTGAVTGPYPRQPNGSHGPRPKVPVNPHPSTHPAQTSRRPVRLDRSAAA